MYRRTHWNNHGKKQIVWRCVTRLNAPGEECPARTLSEVQLQKLVLEAINKVLGGKQRAIKVLETNISEVLGNALSGEPERICELENAIWRDIEITSVSSVAKLGYTVFAAFESAASHLFNMRFDGKRYEIVFEEDDFDDEPAG